MENCVKKNLFWHEESKFLIYPPKNRFFFVPLNICDLVTFFLAKILCKHYFLAFFLKFVSITRNFNFVFYLEGKIWKKKNPQKKLFKFCRISSVTANSISYISNNLFSFFMWNENYLIKIKRENKLYFYKDKNIDYLPCLS